MTPASKWATVHPAPIEEIQADALEAAAKLVESRAPDTFGGNPHTAYLAGALKGLAMAIRAMKP